MTIRFVLVLSILSLEVYGQTDHTSWEIKTGEKLLYYVAVDSTKQDYLVPFIETKLKNLTLPGSFTKVFYEVNSLNILNSIIPVRSNMVGLIQYLNNQPFQGSKAVLVNNQQLLKKINENSYFLRININEFKPLIEYQFLLFRVIKNDGNEELLPDIAFDEYRSSSIFINPEKDDYKEKIIQALKNIVYESNTPPSHTLIVNDRIVNDKVVYLERNKESTISIIVRDEDSPNDQLKVHWQILDSSNKSMKIYDGELQQKSKITFSPGVYLLNYNIGDGISNVSGSYYIAAIAPPTPYIYNYIDNGNSTWENNTLHIFSYGDKYNSTSLLTNITGHYGKINRSELNSSLDPRIRFSTFADSSNDIQLLQLISNPEVGDGKTTEKTIDFIDNFKTSILNTACEYVLVKDSIGNSDMCKKCFNHFYRLKTLSKETGEQCRISIPATLAFKLIVTEHTLTDSAFFKIQYHRRRRLGFIIDENVFVGENSSFTSKYLRIGVGLSYFFASSVSFNSSFGFVAGKETKYQAAPKFYSDRCFFREVLEITALRYDITKIGVNLIYTNTPSYSKFYYSYPNRRLSKFGVGLGWTGGIFPEFKSVYEIYTSWFPKMHPGGSHCFELGIMWKISFEKK